MEILTLAIPCYNSGEYLKNVFPKLQKIFEANEGKIKLVFVDDGSTEFFDYSCCPIKYTLIPLEENLGQSHARQVAIDECDTEWITFMDSDDEVLSTIKYVINTFLSNDKYDYISAKNLICGQISGRFNRILHGKFYRVSFLRKNNIRFLTQLRVSEDTYFNRFVELIVDEDRSFYPDIATYNWKVREGSASQPKEGFFYEQYLAYYLASLMNSTDAAAAIKPSIYEEQKEELLKEIYHCYYFHELYLDKGSKKLQYNMEQIAFFFDWIKDRYCWYDGEFEQNLFSHPDWFKQASQIYRQNKKTSEDIIEKYSLGEFLKLVSNCDYSNPNPYFVQ